jgi:DNA-binding CsgD family transcriptional regulator
VTSPEEDVSSLIGEIYDAAMEPALWPGVLAQIASFVGGSAAAFYAKDASTRTGNVHYDCGASDPDYKRLYFEKYIKIDPTTTGHCLAEIGEPIGTADILCYEDFLGSHFYREWVRPQELVDNLSIALEKSATGASLLAIFRHQRHGVVDEEARRRARLIAPHVRRSALIGRAIARNSLAAAAFAETLDGITTGITLVDGAGHIVHSNVAGQAMLSEANLLRSVRGRLAAIDANAERALQDVMAAAQGGDAAVAGRGVAVPLKGRNGERYVAHALALTSAARRQASAHCAAVAALFVQKADLEASPAAELVGKAFNLTPTELRVLLAVVEMGGVSDAADALGIAQATVKTHLHRLFRKTGTARQAELVRLMAGFANPLLA